MNPQIEKRRYLLSIDSRKLPHHFTDCLVIGSGVAGLRSALEAAEAGQVLLVTKDELSESNTYYAQGGIAAVLNAGDTPESHIEDTMVGGAGLCERHIVELVIREGPERIRELIAWGANFDREGERLVFTREGGHSADRILHAHGDATGKEIARTLLAAAEQHPAVQMMGHTFIVDLITDDEGACRGALAWQLDRGLFVIWAGATILASGGAGQLYRESTNPAVATADGHAMAWRAGATLADMEMIQFHPTTLYIAGASRTLITEAVRGEGAYLLDRDGERFMVGEHPLAELAPRDVVSRAIVRRMTESRTPYVLLDVRHIGAERFAQRFPTIFKLLQSFDIDVATTPIPVRPAAHYMIGGLIVDPHGRSNVRGLLACGEAACSGLHGANRLGSNSLLEGLVFGVRAGQTAAELFNSTQPGPMPQLDVTVEPSQRTSLDVDDVRNSLRSLMGRNLAVQRDGDRLDESAEIIDFWARYVMDKTFDQPVGWQLQNLLTVSRLVVASASARTESRGVHYRRDYPERDDVNWACHLQLTRSLPIERRKLQELSAAPPADR